MGFIFFAILNDAVRLEFGISGDHVGTEIKVLAETFDVLLGDGAVAPGAGDALHQRVHLFSDVSSAEVGFIHGVVEYFPQSGFLHHLLNEFHLFCGEVLIVPRHRQTGKSALIKALVHQKVELFHLLFCGEAPGGEEDGVHVVFPHIQKTRPVKGGVGVQSDKGIVDVRIVHGGVLFVVGTLQSEREHFELDGDLRCGDTFSGDGKTAVIDPRGGPGRDVKEKVILDRVPFESVELSVFFKNFGNQSKGACTSFVSCALEPVFHRMERGFEFARPGDFEVGDIFQETEIGGHSFQGIGGTLCFDCLAPLFRFRSGVHKDPLVDGGGEIHKSLLLLGGSCSEGSGISFLGIGFEAFVILTDDQIGKLRTESLFLFDRVEDEGVDDPVSFECDVNTFFRLHSKDVSWEMVLGRCGQTELFTVDEKIGALDSGKLISPHDENLIDPGLFHGDGKRSVSKSCGKVTAQTVGVSPVNEIDLPFAFERRSNESRHELRSRRSKGVTHDTVVEGCGGGGFRTDRTLFEKENTHFIQTGNGIHGGKAHFASRNSGKMEHRVGIRDPCLIAFLRIFVLHGTEKSGGVAGFMDQHLPCFAVEVLHLEITAEDREVVALHHIQLHGVEGDISAEVETDPVGGGRLVFEVACPVGVVVTGLAVAHKFGGMLFSFVLSGKKAAPCDFDRLQYLPPCQRRDLFTRRRAGGKFFHLLPVGTVKLQFADVDAPVGLVVEHGQFQILHGALFKGFFKNPFDSAGTEFFVGNIVKGVLRLEGVDACFVKDQSDFVDPADIAEFQDNASGVRIHPPVGVDIPVNSAVRHFFAHEGAAVGTQSIVGAAGTSQCKHRRCKDKKFTHGRFLFLWR